jgi:glycosyltransferase involved in cell wall biosynthesis
LKKPIILGLEGEAKELFIEQGKCGVSFIPEDSDDLVDKILYIYNNKEEAQQMGENGLRYASENFNRDTIAKDFYVVLQSLIDKK